MTEQNYASHAHQPRLTYVAGAFTLIAMVSCVAAWFFGWVWRDIGVVSLSIAVAALVAISRIYIVRLQDRIILLEMKIRGAELLTPELEARLLQLRPKQVVALRFASDAELGDLLDKAVRENLSPDQIKREVKHWRPDFLRT
jgi:hypothetical protein